MKKKLLSLILCIFICYVPSLSAGKIVCTYKNNPEVTQSNYDFDFSLTYEGKEGTKITFSNNFDYVASIEIKLKSETEFVVDDFYSSTEGVKCPDVEVAVSSAAGGGHSSSKVFTIKKFSGTTIYNTISNIPRPLTKEEKENNKFQGVSALLLTSSCDDDAANSSDCSKDYSYENSDVKEDVDAFICTYYENTSRGLSELFILNWDSQTEKLIGIPKVISYTDALVSIDDGVLNMFKNNNECPSIDNICYNTSRNGSLSKFFIKVKESATDKCTLPDSVKKNDVDTGAEVPVEPTTSASGSNQVLSDNMIAILNEVYLAIKILAPILAIALSMFDFSKVIASEDKEALKKALLKKLIIRVAILVLIFMLPMLINSIGKLTGLGTLPDGLF